MGENRCECGGNLIDSGGFKGMVVSELIYTCDTCGLTVIKVICGKDVIKEITSQKQLCDSKPNEVVK